LIRSLRDAPAPGIVEADFHVVGAGIAGLIVATRLAAKGHRVVVTESGGWRQDGETHPLNRVEQRAALYAGAEHGRARCLGGTSTLWGGAMLPFLHADLAPSPATGHDGWPVDASALFERAGEVEAMFGLPGSPYDRPDIAGDAPDAAFLPRLAKWPPFRQRNVATLLDEKLRDPNGPEIWLDATACRFGFLPDGRIDSITARSETGNELTIRARETIIAAGAIESTRLLLLADREAGNHIFTPHDVLGRYFHDHLSVPVARMVPTSPAALNRTIGFRFEGKAMRNLRFEPAEAEAVRADIVPGFAHIAFGETEGGFNALRDLFRRLQQRRAPDAKTVAALVRGAPWIVRAVWWRFAEKRLLAPADAEWLLHTVIEQEATAQNRITLSETMSDPFGQPLAAIDWQVSDADRARLTRFTDRFIGFWESTPSLRSLAAIERRGAGLAEAELEQGGGIYHPCGSTRMGLSAADGVVDGDLRCFAIPNLSVAATSVFPTAGGANPTMSLMCAALRLAESF
jgi:choline dehydrogenase-like flavoprotein